MRRQLARTIVVLFVPTLVGYATNPDDGDQLPVVWLKGAGVLALAGVVAWAMRQLDEPPQHAAAQRIDLTGIGDPP